MCVTRATRHAARVVMARVTAAAVVVVKTKVRTKARKSPPQPVANARRVSTSLVKHSLLVNSASRRLVQMPIVRRTSSVMTMWITLVTALITSALTRTRTTKAVVAVRVLRQPLRVLHLVVRVVLRKAVRMARARAQARARVRHLPSAAARVAALHVTVRPVAITVRPAMIRVKSQR